MTLVAVDTNIWAYQIGVSRDAADEIKIPAIREMMEGLSLPATWQVASQTLIELYNLLTRAGFSRVEAFEHIEQVKITAALTATNAAILDDAFRYAVAHRFKIFDAVILATAIASGAHVLLSEDMQHGSTWRGTVILNPLADDFPDRIAPYLR